MTDLPVFRISHTVPLSPDEAFAHWTQPEHFTAWWGPDSVEIPYLVMDVRPGGTLHYSMRDTSTGDESWGKWEVIAVEAPRRLELLNMFSDPEGNPTRHPMAPQWPLKTHAVSTFTEVDGGTRIDIEWTPWEASDEEVAIFGASFDSMTQGWSGSLALWDAYIARRES